MSYAAIIYVAVAAGSAVYSGEKSRKSANKAQRSQEAAQRDSLLSSIKQDTEAAKAEKKANKKRPDTVSLLFQERAGESQGVGSTLLTGGGGAQPTLLGSKSKLG